MTLAAYRAVHRRPGLRYNSGVLASYLQQKLDNLPATPGVYFFKGDGDVPLYVGKAANLRTRVRSYFQAGHSDERAFIDRLYLELRDIETYVTATEKEAALLENGLIKDRQPRYNVKLRDDKDYLSLRLQSGKGWPRLEVVRRPKKDGARYFGPYHSASAARATLRVVNRHFQLRTCTDRELRSRTRPCLQYQIKRCLGPCVYDVDEQAYGEQVKNVSLFLEGRHDELLQHLTAAMQDAAAGLRYELAATYRDQVRAVQSTQQKQRVSLVADVDQDVFGVYRKDDKAELSVLLARRGRVIGVRTFAVRDVQVPSDELVATFVREYYALGSFVPHEIIVSRSIEGAAGLAEMLTEQAGRRVQILRPQRGHKAQLLRLAEDNAVHAYREKARAQEDMEARLSKVMARLGLPRPPERFECIDVSHLGGDDTVAAIVGFFRGEPERKRYRSYRVKQVAGGDDYGAMFEVLTRRFVRGQGRQAGWELPDLLVVDGGKGQLAIAQKALSELQITTLPVVALAKEKENRLGKRVLDRIYLPGRKNPVDVKEAGPAFSMFLHARDEAHRAANALRKKVGKRKRLRSGLEDIQGVGPKTRALLLKTLGSLSAIEAADVETLVSVGATRRQAERIVAHFRGDEGDTAKSEEEALDNAFGSDPRLHPLVVD